MSWAAGVDAALVGGHPLGGGLATSAARNGAPEDTVMRQGRWTTSAALRGYRRGGGLGVPTPSATWGL